LKFPLRPNDPVSVLAVPKHESFSVLNVKLVTLTLLPLIWVKDVPKAKAGPLGLLGSVRVAVQVPLIFPELLLVEPPPQAASIRPSNISNEMPNVFMKSPPKSMSESQQIRGLTSACLAAGVLNPCKDGMLRVDEKLLIAKLVV
jgi:hypothetical protein